MFHSFFSSLARSKYSSIFSLFFLFSLCGRPERQNPLCDKLSFFFFFFFLFFFLFSFVCLINTPFDLLAGIVIRLSLRIPENFINFIRWDGFWFVHIPFDSMVKIQSLAQLQVGQLSTKLCLILYSFYDNYYFFSHLRADGFPLEPEWQQVSSSFHDSSLYSCWS